MLLTLDKGRRKVKCIKIVIMRNKHILFVLLGAFCLAIPVSAQKNAVKVKKIKTSVNADSLEVRKLIDAAKKGDAESQNTLGTYYYAGKKVKQNYDVALKWFSMAGKQKHVKAIANMGLCYQLGHGIKKDSLMAVKLYKESIKAGNAELVKLREENIDKSQSAFDVRLLADLYENGCGSTVKKNPELALKYYKMAADNYNSLDAIIKVASTYDHAKKYAEALPYFQKGADMGNGFAAYKYGDYLCNGKATKVDKAKASTYLDKAVKQHIPNAMMILGDLLYKGDGILQDYAKAMNLYKQAAAKNNPVALWNVGIMYKKGLGVKQNYLIALQWLANASSKGMKANFMKQLMDENVEINNGWKGTDFYSFIHAMACVDAMIPDYTTAVTELAILEKKNIPVASTLLGRCYADKNWKKANEKKMMAYYEKAANMGDPYAYYLLAQLHILSDKAVKADKNKVVAYYEKAIEADYAPAMCELGDLYFAGKIVNKDITKAISYYNSALLNGFLTKAAATNLASCYQQGLGGLKKNEETAKEIIRRGQDGCLWTSLLRGISFE